MFTYSAHALAHCHVQPTFGKHAWSIRPTEATHKPIIQIPVAIPVYDVRRTDHPFEQTQRLPYSLYGVHRLGCRPQDGPVHNLSTLDPLYQSFRRLSGVV